MLYPFFKIIYKENINLNIIISQIFLYHIWFMDMKSKHKTHEVLFMYINYPFLYMVYYICFIIFSKIYYPIWVNINDYK